MLEIVFSEIAANRLMYAQHMGEGEYPGRAARSGLDIDGWPRLASGSGAPSPEFEEEERRRWEKATPLGGSFQDVFCFPDDYSVGPVVGWGWSSPQSRAEALQSLFDGSQFSSNRVYRAAEIAADNRSRLMDRLNTDEDIELRIWSSLSPKDYCGMSWVLALVQARLKHLPPVTVVTLPRLVPADDSWQSYIGWESVAPEEYSGLLRFAATPDAGEAERAAREWQTIEKHNGVLRALVNGSLVTVPLSFYDQFIEAAAASLKEEFRENDLIFHVLDQYDLGISTDWLSFRIDAMLADGRLRATSTASESAALYSRMLVKGPTFPGRPAV